MTRPTWATVVGVLGIIFAGLGVLGAAQMMIMPMIMSFQKKMIGTMEQTIDLAEKREALRKQKEEKAAEAAEAQEEQPLVGRAAPAVPPPRMPKELFRMFDRMVEMPPWFKAWSIAGGLVGMAISGVYLFASIGLLMTKPWAPMFFCATAGCDIAYGVVRIVIQASAMTLFSMAMIPMAMPSFVVNVVLLIVVAVGDKRAFQPQPAGAEEAANV